MFEFLFLIFVLVWTFIFFVVFFFTHNLIPQYDSLRSRNRGLVTHKYQWESKETWEESLAMISGLSLKMFWIFFSVSTAMISLWFFIPSTRSYIFTTGIVFFLIAMTYMLMKTAVIHKSFCPKGWSVTSHSSGKVIGRRIFW